MSSEPHCADYAPGADRGLRTNERQGGSRARSGSIRVPAARGRWVLGLMAVVAVLGCGRTAAGQTSLSREYVYFGGRMVALEDLAPNVSVAVNCNAGVALGSGETRQCTATVSGTSNNNVTWSVVSGGGSINSTSGLYTAPAVTTSTAVQVKS